MPTNFPSINSRYDLRTPFLALLPFFAAFGAHSQTRVVPPSFEVCNFRENQGVERKCKTEREAYASLSQSDLIYVRLKLLLIGINSTKADISTLLGTGMISENPQLIFPYKGGSITFQSARWWARESKLPEIERTKRDGFVNVQFVDGLVSQVQLMKVGWVATITLIDLGTVETPVPQGTQPPPYIAERELLAAKNDHLNDLIQRVNQPRDAEEMRVGLDWLRAKSISGFGGSRITFSYAGNLFRIGSKDTASVALLVGLLTSRVDAARCADPSASADKLQRWDQALRVPNGGLPWGSAST